MEGPLRLGAPVAVHQDVMTAAPELVLENGAALFSQRSFVSAVSPG